MIVFDLVQPKGENSSGLGYIFLLMEPMYILVVPI